MLPNPNRHPSSLGNPVTPDLGCPSTAACFAHITIGCILFFECSIFAPMVIMNLPKSWAARLRIYGWFIIDRSHCVVLEYKVKG